MNLTIYVPKDLEAELRHRAEAAGMTPSLFAQSVLRTALERQPNRFSERFAALAGSWEDERTPQQIIADIRKHRASPRRTAMR